MTVAELLGLARDARGAWGRRIDENDRESRLALAIIDLLGEAQSCGWEAPEVSRAEPEPSGMWIGVPDSWAAEYISPDDARAMARMLLASADEADQAAKERSEP